MTNLEQTTIEKNKKEGKLPPQPLSEIREKITALDAELLSLFSKRRALSYSVAQNKQSSKKPIRDQERERILLDSLVKQGSLLGLDTSYITHLFSIIIDDSVNQQQDFLQSSKSQEYDHSANETLAVLGGKGAYSHLAASKYFANYHNSYLSCDTFEKVLKSVSDGKAKYGVIPIENTISGGITEVYDLLLDSNLTIVGEEKYTIQHCLVAIQGTQLHDIKKILGHPQASRQCNKGLSTLIDADINLVSSSAEAAELFGLEVLLDGIANQANNITRFLIVALESQKISDQFTSKTSIALSTGQKAGSLAEVLLVFRDADIPLSNLESRPIPNKPWEQMFYLDIEANLANQSVQLVLEKVSNLCRFLKVLGCYSTRKST
jgi:chorismate mutase / prephenate dehydratase